MELRELAQQSGYFLLIGCDAAKEQDAMSEFWHVVVKYGQIFPKEILQLPIRGLFLVALEDEPLAIAKKVEEIVIQRKSFIFKYCKRITPLECLVKSELDEILQALQGAMERIPKDATWRISLNRRHTNLDRNKLIKAIASHPKAPKGKVRLENPDWYIIVEIFGEWTGLGVFPENPIVTFEQ